MQATNGAERKVNGRCGRGEQAERKRANEERKRKEKAAKFKREGVNQR